MESERNNIKKLAKTVLKKFTRNEILYTHLLKIKIEGRCYFLLKSFSTVKDEFKVLENEDLSIFMYGDEPEILQYYKTYLISFKYKKEKASSYFMVREMTHKKIEYMYCKTENWCDICFSSVKSNIELHDFDYEDYGSVNNKICPDCFDFLDAKTNGYDFELKMLNFQLSSGVPKKFVDEDLRKYEKLMIIK